MSEPEIEQTQEQDGPEPDESEAGAQPEEHSSGMEAADEMEAEAEESKAVEGGPDEPQALSQKQLEKALDKLDREADRHGKRVAEIMGSDVGMLLDCPLCDPLTPGKIMPTPGTPERFPAVREFMGDAQPADYQQDPNTRTCQTCAGEGVVETGSRVDSQRLLACTDCGGKGWQGSRAPIAASGPMAPAPAPEANGQGEPTPIRDEPAEAAALRAAGYTLIPPVGAPS